MLPPRVLAVLETLAASRRTTARELAVTLGVTEKTIRRDIARLTATGLPIASFPGRNGGLALGPPPPPPVVGGWARVHLPAEHLDDVPVLAAMQTWVRGLHRPGVLLVDFTGADIGAVARAIAALPLGVEIESPDDARSAVAEHARALWQCCGSAALVEGESRHRAGEVVVPDAHGERIAAPSDGRSRRSASVAVGAPRPRVVDRWRELPAPDRADPAWSAPATRSEREGPRGPNSMRPGVGLPVRGGDRAPLADATA